MWNAPPSGLRFISALTTASVSFDLLAHAGARRALAAVDREERLGHRDRDLRRLEADHRAVAADDLVLREARVGGSHGGSGFAGQEVAWGLGRRGGRSARDLHGFFSCRILVVVDAIGAFRSGTRRFVQSHARCGFRDGALGLPLRTPPSRGIAACGVPSFLLANQNLLHLVLKCLMNTKHSGPAGAWQVLFDAQNGGRKRTTKTAHCGAVPGISTHVPPAIHRVVHSARAPAIPPVALRSVAAAGRRPRRAREAQVPAGRAKSRGPAMATKVSPGAGADPREPGETAERRQQRAAAAENEARAAARTRARWRRARRGARVRRARSRSKATPARGTAGKAPAGAGRRPRSRPMPEADRRHARRGCRAPA